MPYKAGISGNPSGRKPGTKNKASESLRNRINDIIDNNLGRVQQDLDSLEPKDRLNFFEKLLQYALPKLQSEAGNPETSENSIVNLFDRFQKFPQKKTGE